ncbi:hypothetical protein PGT21_050135 [Puccinia graminis f. sp. tritici]|uniref:Uncharacterized protein n=1 Tax=Puccinia graminis f. sp. tritici TaxID=56615 RepID=A0A5B0Q389_PUCGR|nr:hypothetical protein PGT21_050135 [Puccinia graminis f. sp. tritici]
MCSHHLSKSSWFSVCTMIYFMANIHTFPSMELTHPTGSYMAGELLQHDTTDTLEPTGLIASILSNNPSQAMTPDLTTSLTSLESNFNNPLSSSTFGHQAPVEITNVEKSEVEELAHLITTLTPKGKLSTFSPEGHQSIDEKYISQFLENYMKKFENVDKQKPILYENPVFLSILSVFIFPAKENPRIDIYKSRSEPLLHQEEKTLKKHYKLLIGSMWKAQLDKVNKLENVDYMKEFKELFDWLKMQMFSPEKGLPIYGIFDKNIPRSRLNEENFGDIQKNTLKYFSENEKSDWSNLDKLAPYLVKEYSNYVNKKMKFGGLKPDFSTDKKFDGLVSWFMKMSKKMSGKSKGNNFESPGMDSFKLSELKKSFPQEELKISEIQVINDSGVPIALFTKDGLNYVNVLRSDNTGPISISEFSKDMETLVNNLDILYQDITYFSLINQKDREDMRNYFLSWLSEAILKPKLGVPLMGRITDVDSISDFNLTPLRLCLIDFISGPRSQNVEPIKLVKILTFFLQEEYPKDYAWFCSKAFKISAELYISGRLLLSK